MATFTLCPLACCFLSQSPCTFNWNNFKLKLLTMCQLDHYINELPNNFRQLLTNRDHMWPTWEPKWPTWDWNSNYYSKVRIVNITHNSLDKDKYQFNHLCKNMNDKSQWWKRVLRKRLAWHTKLLNTIFVIVMVCLLKQNILIPAFFGVTSWDSRYTIHTYMHIYKCVCARARINTKQKFC